MATAKTKPATAARPSFARIEERFRKLTPRSRREYERAHMLIPGGVPGGLGYIPPYPLFIERAEGCHVYDADGRRLVDLINGDWLLPLGHNHPRVSEAIAEQLQKGTTFGCPAPELGYQLARMLQRRMPSLERMRFTASGTEATMLALRLARAFTGRPRIAKMNGGYHGLHDAALIANGRHPDPRYVTPGLIPGTLESVIVLPYNNARACEAIIERERQELAAVIIEPVLGGSGMVPATPEFLRSLRDITRRHDILLIFDEVVTFSLSPGGAQGLYGITPDLTTLGKVIGGGLPLGLYGGRADIMALVDPVKGDPQVRHGSTFGGHRLALAAGVATLKLLTPAVYHKLHRLGDRARRGIEALASKHEVPLQVTGVGHFLGLHWTRRKVVDLDGVASSDREVMKSIVLGLRNEGFLLFPQGVGVLSAPMTNRHAEQFVAAVERVLMDAGLATR